MVSAKATPPKLLVSYSWTSEEHEQWVLRLATELRQSGVDVKLDKWDLREGHDALAFMESMVADDEIKKVIMICDEKYVAKADGRAGGVGTETQIISKKVYQAQDQSKFVALTLASDSAGQALVPIYYSSKIHIDFRDEERYGTSFDQLLRWIFDKPLHVRPEMGPPPAFVTEGVEISLTTTPLFRRCMDALKNNKANASGALNEYFGRLAQELERFRLNNGTAPDFDDAVVKSIDEFKPWRDEAIQVFHAIAQYSRNEETTTSVHRFLEDIAPYLHQSEAMSQWRDSDFDNFRFVVHELFLYALAFYIKLERFLEAATLLSQPYYVRGTLRRTQEPTSSFIIFREHARSLVRRNERLSLRRVSLRADLLKARCAGTGLEFDQLMQADFICFLRADLDDPNDRYGWWPETLIYASRGPFEVFARCVSRAYFDRAKLMLGIELKEDLAQLMEDYRSGSRQLPRWDYQGLNPFGLLGYEAMATKK